MDNIICDLGPCAPMLNAVQRTPPSIGTWISNQCQLVRRELEGQHLSAVIWGYRVGSAQYLACDFRDENGSAYSLTFLTGGNHDFAEFDPMVPDMAEALHIASQLTGRLGCAVRLGCESTWEKLRQRDDR